MKIYVLVETRVEWVSNEVDTTIQGFTDVNEAERAYKQSYEEAMESPDIFDHEARNTYKNGIIQDSHYYVDYDEGSNVGEVHLKGELKVMEV